MADRKAPLARPLVATYRLQLRPEFDFDAAARVVPYLARLGVSHLYLSPILEAATASAHGYDVIDHTQISNALGGRAGYDRLVEAARAHGLSVLIDIVPNHMSIAEASNRWWWDVLENGPAARFASFFDIDWDPPDRKLKNQVLMPVLGDHRAQVLARGEIRVERVREHLVIQYFEHRFPVAPRALGGLLGEANRRAPHPRLAFMADAYQELPAPSSSEPHLIERRNRDRAVLHGLLRDLLDDDTAVATAIDETVAALNADVDRLDEFLDQQNYRLAYWRAAARELDYRRFFDVNSLVGLRVELPAVFEATHAIYAQLAAEQKLDGVRVDHVDGLANPAQYLQRLRALLPGVPVFVEKILGAEEPLPASWPVDGTTGYEFCNDLTALFVDPDGEGPLGALDRELTGEQRSFAESAAAARLEIARDLLDSDLRRLAHRLTQICELHRDARDFTRHDLHEALLVLVASFPVYRTYVDPDAPEGEQLDDRDREAIGVAIERARRLAPNVDPGIFGLFDDLLQLRKAGTAEADFVRRLQQLTPSAFAKGVEDTAFYRDTRLLALNEVGGDPTRFALPLEAFHARCENAQRDTPRRLLATSTHDTKRSEDIRARLVVLAEDHEAFARLATQFFDQARRHWAGEAADRRVTMLVLQTLIGAWPIGDERLCEYLEKALRESKLQTSWARPDASYEDRVRRMARGVLADPEIRATIEAYVARTDTWARSITLGWTLLKLTCPGTPDFYQGNELYRYDLVDPDNRRPLSWDKRIEDADEVSRRKLYLVCQTLAYRKQHPELFQTGSYEPLWCEGAARDRVIAFARKLSGTIAITVVPRWPSRPASEIDDCVLTLPRGQFIDHLSDRRCSGKVRLGELLERFPVALLVNGGGA